MAAENRPPRTDPENKAAKKTRRRRPTPSQKLLTMKQVEDEYGLPVRSIYRLWLCGQLPAVKFTDGGMKWFRRTDVDALIERHIERMGD